MDLNNLFALILYMSHKIANSKIRQLFLLREFNMTDKSDEDIAEAFEEEFGEDIAASTINTWRKKFKEMDIKQFRKDVDQMHRERVENKRLLMKISNKVLSLTDGIIEELPEKDVKTSDLKNLIKAVKDVHSISEKYESGESLEPEKKIEKELDL